MLGQSEQTGSYVNDGPRQRPHALPSLRAGVKAVDQSGLSVIILAVSSQYIDLPLQHRRGCTHMWHRQGHNGSPGVGVGIIHLAGPLVGVKLPQVAHPTGHIKAALQGLHAVQRSVAGHVCQVRASSAGVVEEHGWQAFILRVETTRDEDACVCGGYSMAAENLRQWVDVTEETEAHMSGKCK